MAMTREEIILDNLKADDMKLDELISLKEALEDVIEKRLDSLPNAGGECRDDDDCKEANIYKKIHEGKWDEIIEICTVCGGFVP